jgi:hypothetical protein
MMKALNRIIEPCSHYTTALLVINLCAHELTSPRRLIPYKHNQERKKEQGRMQLNYR